MPLAGAVERREPSVTLSFGCSPASLYYYYYDEKDFGYYCYNS